MGLFVPPFWPWLDEKRWSFLWNFLDQKNDGWFRWLVKMEIVPQFLGVKIKNVWVATTLEMGRFRFFFFWKNWFGFTMLIRFRNHNLPAASKVCSGFKRLPSDATNFKNPCLTKFSELGRQTVAFFLRPPYTTSLGDGYWRCVKSCLGVKKRKPTYSKTILKHAKSTHSQTFSHVRPIVVPTDNPWCSNNFTQQIDKRQKKMMTRWWFQPIEKNMLVKLDHLSQGSKWKNIWIKPPPSNICNVKTSWLSTSTSKKSTKTTNLKKMDDFNQSLSDNIFFCTSFVTSPTFWSISTFTSSECPLGKMISKDAISSAIVTAFSVFLGPPPKKKPGDEPKLLGFCYTKSSSSQNRKMMDFLVVLLLRTTGTEMEI